MMYIFSYKVEGTMEIFINDISMVGDSFEERLANLLKSF